MLPMTACGGRLYTGELHSYIHGINILYNQDGFHELNLKHNILLSKCVI